uniref:Uncharacterized protein n=1 Tax=Anguilla anguilla TaxID=7936 RepID=A0A0E9RW82_ANGAN
MSYNCVSLLCRKMIPASPLSPKAMLSEPYTYLQ